MAPDHCAEELSVPPDEAVFVADTMRSSAWHLELFPAVPCVVTALSTAEKPLVIPLKAGVLLTMPIPPIHSSLAWLVVAVVPVRPPAVAAWAT